MKYEDYIYLWVKGQMFEIIQTANIPKKRSWVYSFSQEVKESKKKKESRNVSNQGSEGPLYEYFQPLKEEIE